MASKNLSPGLLFFLAIEFGLVALLWASPASQDWNLALGSLDIPLPSGAIYGLVVLFPLLFLGFRVWHLGRRMEELERVFGQFRNAPADRRGELGFGGSVCPSCGSKIQSCKGFLCGSSKGSKVAVVERTCSLKWEGRNSFGRSGMKDLSDDFEEEEGEKDNKEEEGFDGDEVMRLRNEIMNERRLRAEAGRELEEERKAAASAADEATAKIMWLQNEKAFLEREARQYREISEQRKEYDQQYIKDLQWLIEKLESEKGEMEGKFESGGQKINAAESEAVSGNTYDLSM